LCSKELSRGKWKERKTKRGRQDIRDTETCGCDKPAKKQGQTVFRPGPRGICLRAVEKERALQKH